MLAAILSVMFFFFLVLRPRFLQWEHNYTYTSVERCGLLNRNSFYSHLPGMHLFHEMGYTCVVFMTKGRCGHFFRSLKWPSKETGIRLVLQNQERWANAPDRQKSTLPHNKHCLIMEEVISQKQRPNKTLSRMLQMTFQH